MRERKHRRLQLTLLVTAIAISLVAIMQKRKHTRLQQATYKGKKILVEREKKAHKLSIDGKPVMIERVGREYWTNLLPFMTHRKSLVDLAKTLIDMHVA
jgi:hypothetical protein